MSAPGGSQMEELARFWPWSGGWAEVNRPGNFGRSITPRAFQSDVSWCRRGRNCPVRCAAYWRLRQEIVTVPEVWTVPIVKMGSLFSLSWHLPFFNFVRIPAPDAVALRVPLMPT
jgi:hypothetical protein